MSINVLKLGSKKLSNENWKVFHPNGKHIFTCGKNKAVWYLERELAYIYGDNSIKFNFEPKGNGFNDTEIFGLSPRKPICVVDGIIDNLQRHHIVPYCYRTHFPIEFKSKNHHDVVLINTINHQLYEVEATKFKDIIALEYGVDNIKNYNSLFSAKLNEFSKDRITVISRFLLIFNGYNKVPKDVIIGSLNDIANITKIDIEFLMNCNYLQLYKLYQYFNREYNLDIKNFKELTRKYYDHGYQVVKLLDTDEKLIRFIKMWRTHFIETMKPNHMPIGWSIDFRCKTI